VNTSSVTDGAAVVKTALDAFGNVTMSVDTVLLCASGYLTTLNRVVLSIMLEYCGKSAFRQSSVNYADVSLSSLPVTRGFCASQLPCGMLANLRCFSVSKI